MSTIKTRLLRITRRAALRSGDEMHVHFHNGPQGSPTPCFDEGCDAPKLRVSQR